MSEKMIITVGVLLGIIAIGYCVYNRRSTEGYALPKPDNAPGKYGSEPAPWIPKKTPIPLEAALDASPKTSQILVQSVDPGAHIVCAAQCRKNDNSQDPNFMQVCVDACMQKKWTHPNNVQLKE